MRILMLNAYFQPEQIAFTHLEKDLLDAFVREGFSIDVIVPIPTRGVDRDTIKSYSKKKKEVMYGGALRVYRFWAPQEGRNSIIRAIRYLWCNLREYQIGKNFKNTDVVFCVSTPPTQGWVAGKVKKYIEKHGNKDVKLVYNLQDIFPDSLINAGLTKKNSLLWKIGRNIENTTYSTADRIIVISEFCKKNIQEKGVSASKITLISNWIDLKEVEHIKRDDNGLFDELKIDRGKFIVLYAGNMGETQGIDVILSAADNLQIHNDVYFVLFGSGSKYDTIKSKVKELKLDNVTIYPVMKMNRISEVYSMGNVALITCKKGTGKAGLPSKLWTIMGCGTPIISAFDLESDLVKHIIASRSGICVEPENAKELSEAILNMYLEKTIFSSSTMREYVRENAEKEVCVNKYVEVLQGVHYKWKKTTRRNA